MSEQEVKQTLIDNYINLLRIKAEESGSNQELEVQLEVVKIKLSSYNIDTEDLEKKLLEK
ncbi:MAG: hypothetical protein IJ075_04860 [Lachnospiraceae bacterium]|nr:hypothetical protein [Lachnospiraceae bacterium]MBQ9607610.1 hypothetical protein [Lachnospiraceae bacterium]